jgi:RNA polymerase sigma-70 factor, ECF subfamily
MTSGKPTPSSEDPPDPGEISVLIESARNGDEAAMDELVRHFSARLLESVRAELGDRLRQRLESQDVMQQVYLDALKSIEHFTERGRDSFFAWLRRIAVNRICDFDRRAFQTTKRGAEVRAADLGRDESMARLFGDLSGSVTSPSMAADLHDRVRLLEKALDQLNDAQREAIQLRYLSHLNVTETASKMGRSERAVRGLCVRALIRMREILGDAI